MCGPSMLSSNTLCVASRRRAPRQNGSKRNATPKSQHSMEGIPVAGVRKLPSGTWRGWYKDYEGHRTFFTLSPTATKQEVRTAAQALEVRDAQIRLEVRPRHDQHSAMLARQIGELIEEYLTWGQLQGGR